ncbi:MAG: hypothetical protein Q7T74_06190, partial [Candidatus Saccharibacteria bacterium]|nr:hypothetical protein [Candidatus Saccharibacteria bacterium]
STGNVNIANGTGTGTIGIGNSNSGAITVQSGSTVGITGTSTVTGLSAGAGTALTVNNSTSTGSIFVASDNGTPVFTIADGGAVTATQLVTLNGGLTVETGDTFTFNGDAFTDLTGAGLVVSSNALTLDITSATGAFVNGGNTFAGTATLGTNDANILSLETTNTSRFQIAAAAATLTGQGATTLTSTAALTVDATAALNLGTTNATSLAVGRSGITTTITGGLTQLTGAVSLTGNGASSFTTTSGALTLTSAAAATWSTSAGALSLDSAAALNLGSTNATSVVVGNTTNTATVTLQGTTGAAYAIGSNLTTGTISIGGTGAQTGTISLGTGTGVQTINLGTGAAAKTVNLGTTTSGSSLSLNSDGAIAVNSQALTFSSGGARAISLAQAPGSTNGYNLTISAGGGGSGGTATTGGVLSLQGGAAGQANANGGNITLLGGTGAGTGVKGLVVVDTATFSASAVQNFTANANITQANIDSSGSVLISGNVAGWVATMTDPTITTAGRVIYVTNSGSVDISLGANTVGVALSITLKPGSTATMYWNGVDWTAAGASSSTDLQAAYDNTAASAGGAEIVLSSTGTGGLTIRNDDGTAITGGLLEVQSSIGSNLFTVNNNSTEYANNGGAESSTFTMWTAAPTAGGTITRYTTVGDNIATGAGSVFVDSNSTANTGVRNTLSSTLTRNLKYRVSFAIRHTSSSTPFSTLDVRYSPSGTNTDVEDCSVGNTVNYGQWTRITCTFIYDNVTTPTSSNAILVTHSDAVDHDYYIDNFSTTVSADVNHAVDGSVDAALGTNWVAIGGSVARSTSVLYDTSGSVAATTTAVATRGVYNNLTSGIIPQVSTQYRVAFYARGDGTNTATLAVAYTPDNNATSVSCTDYSTQVVSASAYTLVTCLLTTSATAPVTSQQLRITQTAGSATVFYVDALTMTLNTNNANNVQIGGANKGGPVTLFTLDRSAGAPIAANNDAYLGSMYYDTTTGRIQCYEADGWGACGAAPDNIVNLNPEYAGAVLNGSGVGTMTADFCSDDTALTVNAGLCDTGEAKNFYKWTSPQATSQTYSIYVTYQLPATFNGFSNDDTVQLTARVDSTANAEVTYEMYKSTGTAVTQCGTGETDVIAGGGDTADTWHTYGVNGNEATGCSFNSSSAGNFVIFKINMKANSNANAYVSTLNFVTTGR